MNKLHAQMTEESVTHMKVINVSFKISFGFFFISDIVTELWIKVIDSIDMNTKNFTI